MKYVILIYLVLIILKESLCTGRYIRFQAAGRKLDQLKHQIHQAYGTSDFFKDVLFLV